MNQISMENPMESWKNDIRKKLREIYGPNSEKPNEKGLSHLLKFLDNLESQNPHVHSSYWRTLHVAYKRGKGDAYFKKYADELMRRANDFSVDYQNKQTGKGYCLVKVDNPTYQQKSSIALLFNRQTIAFGIGTILAKIWDTLDPITRSKAITTVIDLTTKCDVLSVVGDLTVSFDKLGGTKLLLGLASCYLTWQFFVNVRRWKNGIIGSKKCLKNCISSIAKVGGGIGLGWAGVMLFSVGLTIKAFVEKVSKETIVITWDF